MRNSNKKLVPGNVVAIPLGSGMYAFGRLHKDCSVAVYRVISNKIEDLDAFLRFEIAFYAYVFTEAIENCEWPVIGHIPFQSKDEAWPPPQYVQDILDPDGFQIYEKGGLRVADRSEVTGLPEQAMYQPDQLVDRIRTELLYR